MDIIFLPLISVINTLLTLYVWGVIIYVMMSWLISFNVVNSKNQLVTIVNGFLYSIVEPVLQRIRQYLPNLGGLDFSPLLLIMALYFLQNVLLRVGAKLQ